MKQKKHRIYYINIMQLFKKKKKNTGQDPHSPIQTFLASRFYISGARI